MGARHRRCARTARSAAKVSRLIARGQFVHAHRAPVDGYAVPWPSRVRFPIGSILAMRVRPVSAVAVGIWSRCWPTTRIRP